MCSILSHKLKLCAVNKHTYIKQRQAVCTPMTYNLTFLRNWSSASLGILKCAVLLTVPDLST